MRVREVFAACLIAMAGCSSLGAVPTAGDGWKPVSGSYSVVLDPESATSRRDDQTQQLIVSADYVQTYSGDVEGTSLGSFAVVQDWAAGVGRGKDAATFKGSIRGFGTGTGVWFLDNDFTLPYGSHISSQPDRFEGTTGDLTGVLCEGLSHFTFRLDGNADATFQWKCRKRAHAGSL